MYMHNKLRVSHRTRLLTFLFIVVLVFSCFVSVFSRVSFAAGASDIVVNNESELRGAVNNASNAIVISLNNDITLTGSLNITNNKDITLTSNKVNGFYKLFGAEGVSTLFVDENSTLTLDGIIVTHVAEAGVLGGGVHVGTSGQLILYSGEISGNTVKGVGMPFSVGGYSGIGGGVYNRGVFEMHNGKITDNTASIGDGGGVNNGGTFKMFGGEIFNNQVSCGFHTDSDYQGYGGGVCNWGVFEMHNGKITDNTANKGGGVYNSLGTFRMFRGEISSNTANSGGGVYKQGGTFDWRGGVILGNTATGPYGGNNMYPEDSDGPSGGNGGTNNGGDNGSSSGGDNGTSVGDGGLFIGGFSLREVVLICVAIGGLVVGIVGAVLFFASKKEIASSEKC